MRNRGFTLLELLITMVMAGIISAAVSQAYSTGLRFRQGQQASRAGAERVARIDDELRRLISSAQVTASATNNASFFIGSSGTQQPGSGLQLEGNMADTLVFTSFGGRIPSQALESQDDFETQNQVHGPVGGVVEYQLGLTAVGDAGTQEGLFLRTQRPADGDSTQGGTERLLEPDIRSITFEFFDGETWQPTWNTDSQQGVRRIPAAVRVTYGLTDDAEGVSHILIVNLPYSDVTVDNPITQGATQ